MQRSMTIEKDVMINFNASFQTQFNGFSDILSAYKRNVIPKKFKGLLWHKIN